MKLIINISEADRTRIGNLHFIPEDLRLEIAFAISTGTPLEQVRADHEFVADFNVDESRTELEQALDSIHVEQERIELLRIFAEVKDFDFIREMSSEQLWKLILIASMVLDVGKEKRDKE